jgi:AraC-like DNA-binding protein
MLLRKHRTNILQYFSYTENIDLNWWKFVTGAFGAFHIIVLLSFFTEHLVIPINSDFIIYCAVSGFVIILGYFGFRQGSIFSDAHTAISEKMGNADGAAKYEKSGLKEKDANAILESLLQHMNEEKPYLNSTLTIEDVAGSLNISRHSLTQVINQKLNKNFYQFVNEYRVEESKRRILDPQNQSFTLLAIAYDSGFNSKSSFNTIFKQYTGMAPSEFKKSSGNSSSVKIKAA